MIFTKEILNSLLRSLEGRKRKIIYEYYYLDRNLKTIAEDMQVTPSRISQLRIEALQDMRGFLECL
jgi:DNA-directed RNA polymerase specialized sigma subunit